MEAKKEKVVNFGLTDELMNFLNEWGEKNMNAKDEKEVEEKPGLEVKRAIVEVAKKEIEKIKIGLEKDGIDNNEWNRLIDRLDKISDMIRWY